MSASACNVWKLGLTAALLGLAACGEPATYRFGTNLTGLLFSPVSKTEGVYPSTTVLNDPTNPFAYDAPNLRVQPDAGIGTKWVLQGGVGGVPAFFAFATALTQDPTGENQYYTAQLLGEIALSGAVGEPTTAEDVRLMAIAGYQATLDYFPNSVSYFADGVRYFPLDVLAYRGATGLGGTIHGWTLVEGAAGSAASVVRTAEYTNPLDGGH
jgi:hypothetical protein